MEPLYSLEIRTDDGVVFSVDSSAPFGAFSVGDQISYGGMHNNLGTIKNAYHIVIEREGGAIGHKIVLGIDPDGL
jgi:hypothetical protein